MRMAGLILKMSLALLLLLLGVVYWNVSFVSFSILAVLSVRDCVGCFLSYGDVVVVQCVRYVYRVSEGDVLAPFLAGSTDLSLEYLCLLFRVISRVFDCMVLSSRALTE